MFFVLFTGDSLKESYAKFKNYPFHGLYMLHCPVLMINDPNLIKQILVKDFSNFCDRGWYCNQRDDPMTGNLSFMSGKGWRNLRSKLSPAYSSGKLKQMFPLIMGIADEMIDALENSLKSSEIVNVKDLAIR